MGDKQQVHDHEEDQIHQFPRQAACMDGNQIDDHEEHNQLHVVMFPWLAMGHIIPFFQLSKCLAQKGLHISFVSTPKNIQKLPKIPPNLSSLIHLVSLPFKHDHVGDDLLPENAESTTDIPMQEIHHLKNAFDGLESSLTTFLEKSKKTDWIVHDYPCHWLPEVGAKLRIPCVFFTVFSAAALALLGPPTVLLNPEKHEMGLKRFTTVPKWVPFPSNIVYRLHELLQLTKGAASPPSQKDTSVSDMYRYGKVIQDCNFVALRSCVELESEWLNLLTELYKKPVIPVGLLPPSVEDRSEDDDDDRNNNWFVMKEWLDKQREGSVVYVALGTEAVLTQEQANELALGLESSELPFFWVLRKPPNTTQDVFTRLPEGFEERTRERGIIWMSWVPQVRILAHPSVGGCLTHCGLSSVVECLEFGRPLILLPMVNDQGLNARLLEGKKLGMEIPRDERDGSFRSASVAETLRAVMVEEEGELLREKGREVFGDHIRHDSYLNSFVQKLKERTN